MLDRRQPHWVSGLYSGGSGDEQREPRWRASELFAK